MGSRVVHNISSECEVFVSRASKNHVRIRITETDPDIPNPTDVEFEGDPKYLTDTLRLAADILLHLDELAKEPS